MDNLIAQIEDIEAAVFAYDINTAMGGIEMLTEELIVISSRLAADQLRKLMEIMGMINLSLANKDYLLLNDILEYELKPFPGVKPI